MAGLFDESDTRWPLTRQARPAERHWTPAVVLCGEMPIIRVCPPCRSFVSLGVPARRERGLDRIDFVVPNGRI